MERQQPHKYLSVLHSNHSTIYAHHYFRRILCNYLGGMMERGEMTANEKLVGEVIKDVCYRNAVSYLGVN